MKRTPIAPNKKQQQKIMVLFTNETYPIWKNDYDYCYYTVWQKVITQSLKKAFFFLFFYFRTMKIYY